ncbi:hypothetical protein [Planobispora rosea]|uniref:hypothetical protein n=1 Tax=Planobispora rosea TaxID=35762 RepID=UPI00083B0A68|nr:hypothetical protein [Planobispora rosea]
MAEIEKVAIHHPRIDDGERVIEVPASALDHYARSGWQRYEPPADEGSGELLPGTGMVTNTTGEPEPVIEPPADEGADPPPLTEQHSPEAPAEPGASSSEESPRRRRATKEEGQ